MPPKYNIQNLVQTSLKMFLLTHVHNFENCDQLLKLLNFMIKIHVLWLSVECC